MMIYATLLENLSSAFGHNFACTAGRYEVPQFKKSENPDAISFSNAKINEDYDIARTNLREKLDESYPDNYKFCLRHGYDRRYDYSKVRSEAITASSAAIAMSLRKGSNVEAAAIAGAKIIGF
nr:hypothetical protein [Methylobacterium sp. L1A1]